MSFEKILRYTGAYGQAKSAEEKTMQIDGECSITNYNPKEGSKPNGYIKVEAYNNSIFVEEGAHSDKTPEVADFSGKKAKILEIIARDGVLSIDDIFAIKSEQKEKEENISKWNSEYGLAILSYRVDHNNGVLTIKWADNDILRIDFSKETKEAAFQNKKDVSEQVEDKKDAVKPVELKARPVEVETEPSEGVDAPETHKVISGETLGAIVKKYGLSLSAVIKLNPGLKPDTIKEGQIICLREGEYYNKLKSDFIKSQSKNAPVYYKGSYPTTHEVERDETLDKIADKYQLFTQELMDANPNVKAKSLSIGTILQIPAPKKLKGLNDLSKSGQKFLSKLRDLESRGHGYYTATNDFGYMGAYQMGKAALKDIGVYYEANGKYSNRTKKEAEWNGIFLEGNLFGITSVDDFLNSPEKQDKAIIRYMQLTWKYIEDNGLDKYVGSTIAGVNVTETGLIAACHLVGRGRVKDFLSSGGSYIPKDGNDTPVTKYLGDEVIMGENRDFKF